MTASPVTSEEVPTQRHAGSVGVVALPYVPQNPYQRLLYEALEPFGLELSNEPDLAFTVSWLRRARDRISVLHFHWPQGYYTRWRDGPVTSSLSWVKLALFAVRLAAARALGYRIVWTVHEVSPHEPTNPLLDRLGPTLLARASHALITHDDGTTRRLEQRLGAGGEKVRRIVHGSYIGVYPPGRDRATVRRELGIPPDAVLFLSFGHIRRYKAVATLLEAFAALESENARLVVAGLPMDEESVATIRAAAAGDPRITPVLEFVPDDAVAELFEAADVAVYARADGGTSGALVLALSLGKPVVVGDIPDYRELTADGAAGWLFESGSAASLADTLARVVEDADERSEKRSAALACVRRFSWPAIADQVGLVLRGDRSV